ncbi:MAG: ABC transporter ATP-binding protein [Candidatus Tantalella remota]|nr:ABC transporter ATP-binding protein [Candidatus Tantalella remota]
MRKYKIGLMGVSLLKLISFPIGLAIIYITKNALDNGIFAKNLKVFVMLTLAGLAVYSLVHVISYVSYRVVSKISMRFSVDVNYDLAKRLFGLNYLEIKRLSSADNVYILGYDYANIENLVFSEIPSLLSIVKIPVLFVLSAMISPLLTFLVFISIPFVVLHTAWASQKRKQHRFEEVKIIREHNTLIHDIVYNLKLIKSYAKEKWVLEKVITVFEEMVNGNFRTEMVTQKTRFIASVFYRINTAVFWILGGYLVITGKLTFGLLSAVLMYTALILGELDRANNAVQGLNEERPSIARCAGFIKDFYDEKRQRDESGGAEDIIKNGQVEVKELTFGYGPGKPVFENFSVIIPDSGWTVIQGVSGVGKTTLLSLLSGLFTPWEGNVIWAGRDLRDIHRESFIGRISVVHQEPYLLNDTLLNNILMGEELCSGDLEKAVGCAKIGELAESLPLGYNSKVGEDGSSFSGGQKQRIAIARALYRNPLTIIMDEATSFVDSRMEEDILNDIKIKYPGLRVIFVTHRDSAVKFADEVLVLEDNRITRPGLCAEIKE